MPVENVPGSSPHTRGAPVSCRSPREFWGIIPAYAGSTHQRRRMGPDEADHPRIRGEHGSNSATTIRSTGSSPHTRGALSSYPTCELPRRIIPAYAGSTV